MDTNTYCGGSNISAAHVTSSKVTQWPTTRRLNQISQLHTFWILVDVTVLPLTPTGRRDKGCRLSSNCRMWPWQKSQGKNWCQVDATVHVPAPHSDDVSKKAIMVENDHLQVKAAPAPPPKARLQPLVVHVRCAIASIRTGLAGREHHSSSGHPPWFFWK